MVIPSLVVKRGLVMTSTDIARKIRDVVLRKWTVFDPTVKEPLVVAHARLAWFYRDRHNEVRGVDFTNFPPNKERTIRHSFQNGLRRKTIKTVTRKRVLKRHARGYISIVGTAPMCTIKWNKKLLYVNAL